MNVFNWGEGMFRFRFVHLFSIISGTGLVSASSMFCSFDSVVVSSPIQAVSDFKHHEILYF